MSQFQQPNRRPAPGVVDLGTGRQANMQQRNLRAGAIGSRGVMGGQSLRGTDSAVRANSVDAVSYLLGEAAQGVNSYTRNIQAIKGAFETRGRNKLKELDARRDADIANGMAEEEVNINHRKRLSELRASGEIDKDLDAFGALNKSFVAADKATDTDIAKRELKELETKLAQAAHTPQGRIDAIEALRVKYNKSQVGDILRDKLNSMTLQAEGAKTQQEVQRDVRATKASVKHQHDAEMTSAGVLLDVFNSEGIVLTDSNAQARITDLYIDKYYGDALEAASSENRAYIRNMAIDHLVPIVAQDMGIAQAEIKRNNVAAEHMNATAELDTLLQEDITQFDILSSWGAPNHRRQTSVSFSRAASLSYDQTDRSMSKGEYMYSEVLLKQGISLARNADDPIEAMRRLRGVMPEDLQSAVDLGWIPEGVIQKDGTIVPTTQEAWNTKRGQWMDQLRTAQLEASTGAFAQMAENNSGSIENLLDLTSSLVDMAGFQGPVGLSDDGTSIDMPTGLSMEGEAYNKIWTSIQTPMNRLLKAQAEANQPGFIDAAITSGSLEVATTITRGLDKQVPTADTVSNSSTLNFISNAPNLESIEQWLDSYKTSDRLGNEVLPEFFREYDDLVKKARNSNISPGSPQFRGMLHGIGVRAWQNGPGMTTGDESSSGLRILVPTSTQTYVTNSFYGTEKGDGPLESGPAAAGIATLWGSLANEDARRKVFGDRYNDARLTFKSHNRDGNWNDENLGWDGVVTNATANRQLRAEGFKTFQQIIGDGVEPVEFVQAAVDMIMSPALSSEGSVPAGGEVAELAVYTAVRKHKAEIVKTLTDELGIDPEEDSLWYSQALPLMRGISADIALDVAEAISTRREEAGSEEGFAKLVAEALDERLSRALDGRVWVGGQIQDDPTGSFANAARQMRERNIDNPNSNESMFNYYTEAPFSAVSNRSGRGESEDGMAETFYAMFPALDRDAMDQDALFAKARERAGDREELTAKDLIAAHYAITTGGDDGIFGDEGMFRDTRLNTRRLSSGGAYSMRFELPNLSGAAVYGMLEFAPPVDVRSSNPIDLPRSVHYVPPVARVIDPESGATTGRGIAAGGNQTHVPGLTKNGQAVPAR